jgi:hypothetical protein
MSQPDEPRLGIRKNMLALPMDFPVGIARSYLGPIARRARDAKTGDKRGYT